MSARDSPRRISNLGKSIAYKDKNSLIKIYLSLPNSVHYLLVGGRGPDSLYGKMPGAKNCLKTRRLPPVKYTLCWAHLAIKTIISKASYLSKALVRKLALRLRALFPKRLAMEVLGLVKCCNNNLPNTNCSIKRSEMHI